MIQIIKASKEDAKEILSLQKICYQRECERYNDYTIPPMHQNIESMQEQIQTENVLKAIFNNQIVGSVRSFTENGICQIGRLIVHPDFENNGLGTRLMKQIESMSPNCDKFELFTGHLSEAPLYLYQKLGYQKFKEIDAGTHRIVFLSKDNPNNNE